MALSREEVEQIAEATAEKVVTKSKGNPVKEPMYSMCSCGTATTHMLSSLYHALEDYKEYKEISGMAKSVLDHAFRELEARCPADMVEVEDIIKKIQDTGTISEKELDTALHAMFEGFTGCMQEAKKK